MNNLKKNYDIIIFWICLIDLMFLPYLHFVSTNFSIVLIAFWCLVNIKKILVKENVIYFIMMILMILSTMMSFFIYPKFISNINIPVYNTKVCFQFVMYILYFIFFKYIFTNYKINLKKPIIFMFLFALLLCLIYMIDKNIFAYIKLFWNNADELTLTFLKNSSIIQYRYNFIWTDPNNPAYFFTALLFFYLVNFRSKKIEKLFLFISTLAILVACMSSGGFASFFITLVLYLTFTILAKSKSIKENFRKNFSKNVIKSITIIAILFMITTLMVRIPIFKESILRIKSNTIFYRVDIWYRIITNTNLYKYLLIGTGGTQVILNNHQLLFPHSGELYLFYSFGLIYLCLFMYQFFRRRVDSNIKKYIFVLPIFIGFSINTAVGEQKMWLLYLLLYVYYFYETNDKINNKKLNITNRSNDLISIIVPVFNSEKYIDRCLNSIVSQKYSNIEIILVDDGSTDNSLNKLKEFAKVDNRIKIFHHENSGVSYTRNVGINNSNGKYIMFVDSDDLVDENMVSDLLGLYDSDVDLVISGMIMKDSEDNLIDKYLMPNCKIKFSNLISNINKNIPLICICGPCCKLYKASIIKDNDIRFDYDLTMGEDTDFNIKYYYFVNQKIRTTSNVYYYYLRENENSLFTKYYPNFMYLNDAVFSRFLKLIEYKRCNKSVINHFKKIYFEILFSSNNSNFQNMRLNSRDKRISDLQFLVNHSVTKQVINFEPTNVKEKIIYGIIKNNNVKLLYLLFFIKNL